MIHRMLRTTLAALLVAAIATAGAVAPALAVSHVPRVAIIVGPTGSVTERYRTLGDEAAAAARKLGAEVVTVYSPNATWPAVQRATEGASIVVYLGHGNGWPSPYRDALYPPTQDGFGLNPVAGVDDRAHQYFGEKYVAGLHLASNAVVVFSHLCYASGNSEPGLPEGTRDTAIQRVDNYAAGFLQAGARAVVAEAYLAPSYYVNALLKSRGTIESIWNHAPTANGHTFALASARTTGFAVRLDPEKSTGGYVRSLVSKGVTAAQLRAGASGVLSGGTSPLAPSLAGLGVKFSEPAFKFLPIAGTTTRLTLAIGKGRSSRIPAGTAVSVRWDPILIDPPTNPSGAASPDVSPQPSVSPLPDATPTAVPTPTPTAAPEPLTVDLVVPEQPGSVVEPVKATRSTAGLGLSVRYPRKPGLYRFSVMLHTPAGVAYDAATQALLVPMLVRVGGPIAAAYGAPATLAMVAGLDSDMAVLVMNAGSSRWDRVVTAPPSKLAGEPILPARTSTLQAQLVATWISASGQPVPDPLTITLDDVVAAPGGSAGVDLHLEAPALAGEYLLILDVLSPASGPMSAQGTSPAIVRVSVAEPPPASQPPPVVPVRTP